MASIISPVWSSIRGSIAGTTYLTTPAGQIIGRQRTRPVNTPTTLRTIVKNGLANGAVTWTELTDTIRNKWDLYALSVGGGRGRQFFVAGQSLQYYMENAPAIAPVIASLGTAPEFSGLPTILVDVGTFSTISDTGVSIKVTNPTTIDQVVVVQVSPGLSPARHYWKGPWDGGKIVATSIAAGANNTFDIGGLVADLRYFLRVRGLTADSTPGKTGRVCTAPSIVDAIAVTNP